MGGGPALLAPLAVLGRATLTLLAGTGRLTLFILQILRHALTPPWYLRELGQQLLHIGWLSLPVVGLTALFTGGALALQIYAGGSRFNAESVVPSIVAIGMTRELGPVLGGLMVAGRVAAAIAAEIGTMKVTEQIDALTTLSTNPIKYLAVPRVLAATLTLPVLVAVGDSIGIFGGFLVGTTRLGFDAATYLDNTADYLELWDVISGLIKGAAFGFIVAVMGCYHGMGSGRGARGVGRATTKAVVSASILILGANYLLTEVFFRA
ncbi:ABC transporter permease [Roseibacterium beibuensis]|uniref:ABC transporter permease n=1 Tax=[Roseibacterium] beibuensis TaxID=1193142 RepID=A0ABP9LLP1_9RHOB|nr:ABC transporter permease [Roseibacterium beibuensis]MCS6625867.1 ABC transporter permease [Roseibacterium beibuensis]